MSVNHSKHFVDPDTGAHTQKIEAMWRALKHRVGQGGVRHEDLHNHFAEFIYMRQNRGDIFNALVRDIAKQWPC